MIVAIIGVFLINFALIISSWPIVDLSNAVGGVEVNSTGRFPYQVAMFIRFPSATSFCGGSIISRRLILTCAHCLIGSNSVSIYYGSEKLSNLDFDQNQVVYSENYRIHPQYSSYVNDVALIRMNTAIVFSSKCFCFLT